MADTTLPTGPALADALYAAGLLPPDGASAILPVGSAGSGVLGSADWEPWRRIEHCWYLLEQMGLSIDFRPIMPTIEGSIRQASWWVGERGLTGVRVDTFAEVPTAICNAALKVHAWRTGG